MKAFVYIEPNLKFIFKQNVFIHTCVRCPELPSNMSTMNLSLCFNFGFLVICEIYCMIPKEMIFVCHFQKVLKNYRYLNTSYLFKLIYKKKIASSWFLLVFQHVLLLCLGKILLSYMGGGGNTCLFCHTYLSKIVCFFLTWT